MDITLLTPEDIYEIRELVEAIIFQLGFLHTRDHDDAVLSAFASIGDAAENIKAKFADVWYIFKCSACGFIYATSQSNLELMTKPCSSKYCDACENAGSMIFVEITTKRPSGATICGTF